MAGKRQGGGWKGLGSRERGRMEGRGGRKGEVVRWLWICEHVQEEKWERAGD